MIELLKLISVPRFPDDDDGGYDGGGGDDVVMVMMCNKFGDFVYCLLAHKPISPQNTKC